MEAGKKGYDAEFHPAETRRGTIIRGQERQVDHEARCDQRLEIHLLGQGLWAQSASVGCNVLCTKRAANTRVVFLGEMEKLGGFELR